MSLHRLIYCSQPKSLTKPDIQNILYACERNNPAAHITGMLLFTSEHFVQLLEGSRSAVNKCFQKISRDPRHDVVEVLSFAAVDTRQFGHWTMHYVAQDACTSIELLRYSSEGRFTPNQMSTSAIETLCAEFSSFAHDNRRDLDSAA